MIDRTIVELCIAVILLVSGTYLLGKAFDYIDGIFKGR